MLVGVLGGMGPAATVDFMAKLTLMTNAGSDQEHVPMIVLSDPRVPDRSDAICGKGPSPLPALFAGIEKLEAAGAALIAIPCNTSHYWFRQLSEKARIPIVSIIEATVAATVEQTPNGGRVGIIATAGAIAGGIYQSELERRGLEAETLEESMRNQLVEGGIRAIKAGDLDQGQALLKSGLKAFRRAGCRSVILGCTEASVALDADRPNEGMRLIDSNGALVNQILNRIGRGVVPLPPRRNGFSDPDGAMAVTTSA